MRSNIIMRWSLLGMSFRLCFELRKVYRMYRKSMSIMYRHNSISMYELSSWVLFKHQQSMPILCIFMRNLLNWQWMPYLCSWFYSDSKRPNYSKRISMCCMQSPCATCINTPDYCTSCVNEFQFMGWKCSQSFYFGFSLTLLTTLSTFNTNYSLFYKH